MEEIRHKMKHYNIWVRGKVQGVFFRKYTRQKAMTLGLTGFVRNEADGSVYIEAEGDDEKLEMFRDWCRTGSPSSRVSSVEVRPERMRYFEAFTIEQDR
jgi:acylphosphatase